jgi:PAS domain S-box-containing protein
VTITAEQALSADFAKDIFDAKLVRVRGRLLDLAIRSTEKILLLQQGTLVFSASLTDEATSEFYSSLRVGSLLDLTGVCSVQVDDNRNPKSFRIYLRSPADIVVRERGPWWSLEHTIELVAIAGTLVLLTMGWIALLRRRVQAQTQLIQQRLEREQVLEVRYRELFESNPHSMWVYDKETLAFLAVNDAAVHYYGYSREEFLRMTIKDIRPATELDALMKKLEVIRDQGIDRGTRWRHHKRNGVIIDVEVSSHQLLFAGREAKLVLVIDITERLLAENALRESEERFRDLFENATDLIQSLNPDGTFAYVNRAWFQTLKYEPEEVAELTFQTLVHPDHLSDAQALFQRVLSGEKLDRFEAVFVSKDGCNIAVEGSCNCKFHDGKPISIRGIFRDVTERKRKEEELRHTRAFLNSVVEHLPIMVFIKEAEELRFVRLNKAGEELLGYSNDEVIGKNDYDFFPPEEANYFTAKDRETLEKGRLVEIEEETIQTRHRGIRFLRTKKLSILGETGKPAYLLGISEDITERKRAEAELEKAHKDLVEVSRRAGMAEVATGVLHNVGNVLNSVNVSSICVADNLRKSKGANLSRVAALLLEHETDLGAFITQDHKGKHLPAYLTELAGHLAGERAAALEELALLQRNIEHIKDIVAMQQSYAKISGVTETVQVSDLVEDALRMNASSLVRHDVEAIREFEEVPPITVEKQKVLQILVNLIRNAKQACDEADRPDKQLTVRVTNGDNRVRIAVIDNGIGIPPENLTRIFGHGFTTRKDGHGFGLHSGALAAKELGGALNVRSEGVGQGAMFILELPLERSRSNYD